MAFRVIAFFNDGTEATTAVVGDITPIANERLFIRHGDRLVEGIVTDILKGPTVLSDGHAQIVDEVLFQETGNIIQFPRTQN